MKRLERWRWAGVLVILLALTGSGCTKAARRERRLTRGERDFQAQRYDRAELEFLSALNFPPYSPKALSRLGVIYSEEGRAEAALPFLRSAVEAQTNDLSLRLRLGRTFLNLHGTKEARQQALYIIERQPTNGEALVLLVESCGNTNDLQDCRLRLAKLEPQAREVAGFHVAAGLLHIALQDRKGARTELEKALALDPKSSVAYLALGNLLLLEKEQPQAGEAFSKASAWAPLRSAARLRYADFLRQSGDGAGARRLLQEITTQAPDYIPAWNRLADIALSEKQTDEAEKLVKTVLGRDPLNYDALGLSSRLSRVKGDTNATLEASRRMSSVYARSPQAKYRLAVSQFENGDSTQAAATLAEVLRLQPNHEGATLLLAQLQIARGDYEPAVAALNRLLDQGRGRVAARLLLAEAYRLQNKAEAALAVYNRLASAYPHEPRVPCRMGLVYLQQGQRAQARQAFEKALAVAPDYLPASEQLVEMDLAATNFAGARQQAMAALEKNPRAVDPQYWLARVHWAQGQRAEAESVLTNAIAHQPGYRPAYTLLVQVYLASNRAPQALNQLEAMVARNPKDVPALLELAMLQTQRGDFAAGRAAYERVLAVDPRSAPALNNLACLYAEHFGLLDKAYELARQVHEMMPQDPISADTLGWVLYQRREYARGLSLLQQSAEKLPESGEIQFHLGMASYMTGQEASARGALQRAAQAKAEFTGKAEARVCLGVLEVEPSTADSRAVAFLEQSLKTRPQDPVVLTRLGMIRERQKRFPEARSLYEQAWEQNSNSFPAASGLARLWADHLGDTTQGLAWAKRARALSPDDAAAGYLLGRLAYRTGDFSWALDLLQESARKLPNDPEVRYDLAWAQYSLGQLEPAVLTMQAATNSSGLFARAEAARRFLALCRLYEDPSAAARATPEVQGLLKAEPGYGPAVMAAGAAAEQQNQAQVARQAYEEMLARFPKFAPATKRLAVVCVLKLGDYQKGYQLAQQARQAFPADPEVGKILAIAAYHRGEHARAAQLLTECSTKTPADADTFYYLGMADYQLKRTGAGKEALKRALALNLDPQRTQEAKRVLGLLN